MGGVLFLEGLLGSCLVILGIQKIMSVECLVQKLAYSGCSPKPGSLLTLLSFSCAGDRHTFSGKGQRMNIVGSAGHIVSFVTVQLCRCSRQAATVCKQMVVLCSSDSTLCTLRVEILIIFLFCFWLGWAFIAVHGLSLVAASGGYSLVAVRGLTPRHVESSRTRDRTHVPCIGRWVLNRWTTGEI